MQFIQEHIIIGLHIIVSYSYLYSARIYWWWDSSQWRWITQSRIRINMLHQKLSWAVFHLVATSATQCMCYPTLVNVNLKVSHLANYADIAFIEDFNIPFQQFSFRLLSDFSAITALYGRLHERTNNLLRKQPMPTGARLWNIGVHWWEIWSKVCESSLTEQWLRLVIQCASPELRLLWSASLFNQPTYCLVKVKVKVSHKHSQECQWCWSSLRQNPRLNPPGFPFASGRRQSGSLQPCASSSWNWQSWSCTFHPEPQPLHGTLHWLAPEGAFIWW